jgi:hypothetical protein
VAEPLSPRTVDVAPERLHRWLAGFTERHGAVEWSVDGARMIFSAADGSRAIFEPAFPPLPANWQAGDAAFDRFVEHATRPRAFGVLLVRLGGYAAGVFDGVEWTASKVGSRQVHGRSAAGGWSQHRFARRREGQVKVALDAAVEAAVRILVPVAPRLDAVVTGGDRQALRTVLGDVRLAAVAPLVVQRVLDVPDPKAKVLRDSLAACRAVRVTISEPQ